MTIIPDFLYSTLQNIRNKARLLSRSPDPNQLTDAQLDNYINTFILYDFPEHFRLFNFKTVLEFYTKPYIDIYESTYTDVTDPLYNFKNQYITVAPPVYVAGYPTEYTQSRAQFFGYYPNYNSIIQVGSGDGSTLNFSGVINTANSNIPPYIGGSTGPQALILQNNVIISSMDASGNPILVVDQPTGPTTGNLITPNNTTVSLGTINYVTGQFSVTFNSAPASGIAVNASVVSLTPSRPLLVLFYDQKFVMRPVPDQVYKVTIEAYIRPTQLMSSSDIPDLAEFWQYIAYGAAKKILEDRNDLDTVQLIMPEFEQQGLLCQRRTLVQLSNQRSYTIYARQLSENSGGNQNGWNNFGNLG